MGAKDTKSLARSDRKLILALLELEKASVYALAKYTEMSYASMFMSIKKLKLMNLVRKLREVKSRKGGRKIIYVLTQEGKYVAGELVDALWGVGHTGRSNS